MTQSLRLPAGGIVDRARDARVRVRRRDATKAIAGDTLASALLANGVHLVGRSFKYHRPRGIVSAGADEPNALVQLARGARTEPNVRATTQELYDGLVAASQNRWPSLSLRRRRDQRRRVAAHSRRASTTRRSCGRRRRAGGSATSTSIRRAAGMGRAASEPDPDHYEHQYAHCDVLVIGAGPAGLAAARAAAHAGARVMRVRREPGVRRQPPRRGARRSTSGPARMRGSRATSRELAARADVTLLPRTTAFGYYDDNLVGLVERVADHLPRDRPTCTPRQRLWKVRAGTVVLASGAHERGIAYANNDLPGTMLAGAARTYVKRYARAARNARGRLHQQRQRVRERRSRLHDAGVAIAAIVDARPDAALDGDAAARARAAGMPIVAESRDRRRARQAARRRRSTSCRSAAARRGGSTAISSACRAAGIPPCIFTRRRAASFATTTRSRRSCPTPRRCRSLPAGAANGRFDLAAALADGHAAGLAAAARAGLGRRHASLAAAACRCRRRADRCRRCGAFAPRDEGGKRFVDWQNDVTVDDIALAAREGYRSVEHLKRYTTLGMGTDQGKTSNIVGLALLAAAARRPDPAGRHDDVPPAVHAGDARRVSGHATRARTSSRRAIRRCTTGTSSTARASSTRACGSGRIRIRAPANRRTTRRTAKRRTCARNVGVVDVSTLGKIELQGRDVAEFLNRVYINRWDTLAVGRCRYGVMLRDDGMVFDDGTTSRLAPTHYLMTTTTVNAVKVHAASRIPAAGRVARARGVRDVGHRAMGGGGAVRARLRAHVLAKLVDIDVSNAAFPFLAVGDCRVRTASGRDPGAPVPDELLGRARLRDPRAGGPRPRDVGSGDRGGRRLRHHAVRHRGDEHAAHRKGTRRRRRRRPTAARRPTTSAWASSSARAKWCIGKPLLARPALTAPDRWQLVGLTALDGAAMPRAGEDRRRSRSRAAEPDAGARDVVVLEPESRRVDRAGARRERPRAARRNPVGGVAARRREGPRARRPAVLHRSRRASGCVSDRKRRRGRRDEAGHYGAAGSGVTLAEATIATAWNVQGDAARSRPSTTRCGELFGARAAGRAEHDRAGRALTALWLGPRSWLLVAADEPAIADFARDATRSTPPAVRCSTSRRAASHGPSPARSDNRPRERMSARFPPARVRRRSCAQSVLGHVNALFYRRDASSVHGDGRAKLRARRLALPLPVGRAVRLRHPAPAPVLARAASTMRKG